MYGLIGSMTAQPGKRDELAAVLGEATGEMPGCLGYLVALDKSEPDTIWIIETWDDKESHDASLTLPAVQAAISRARPLIAGFGFRVETTPVAGIPQP